MTSQDAFEEEVRQSRRQLEQAVGAVRDVVEGQWGLTRERQRWLLPLLVGATAFFLARQLKKD